MTIIGGPPTAGVSTSAGNAPAHRPLIWRRDAARMPTATTSPSRSPARAPRPRVVDALGVASGLGLGAVLGLAWAGTTPVTFSSVGGTLAFAGQAAALVGTYAMLTVVLLAGRLGVLERAMGQDRLLAWHRRLAPWALALIVIHVLLTTLAAAAAAKVGPPSQLWTWLTTTPGMLMALAGTGLLVIAAATSYRAARRRLSHETWWAVHLYTYLGLALSLTHQLTSGTAFATTSWARPFWLTLWAGTAGTVLVHRVMVPLIRTVTHDLRVESVSEQAPGIVAITLRGRWLHRLPLSGGQFLHWRFLRRGLWWQAHPYSVSGLPHEDRLRITVKDLGDHSRSLTRLAPGTRVAFEGPYGAFTAAHRVAPRALLIGGGVGVTPIRALLEDLPAGSRPTVLLRARDEADLVHADEIEDLAAQRGGDVIRLLGSRREAGLSAATLLELVPDARRRDVYVCGPPGLADQTLRAARHAGVPTAQLHHESFAH